MTRFLLFALISGAAMTLGSCASNPSRDAMFERLANGYIQKFLELNPETATRLGDHRFDHRMNDYSLAGAEHEIEFNRGYLDSLSKIDPAKLGEVNRIDYYILRNSVEGTIFRLEVLREREWNPQAYNIGGAVYSLIARDFAPVRDRLINVKARLEAVPQVLAFAKANLKNPPRVHTETAISQNRGNITLIRDELQPFLDEVPELQREFAPIRDKAVAALEYYGAWLEKDLLPASNGDFRLGKEKFGEKLKYTLESDLPMEEILKRAESELEATQRAIYETALPLYKAYFRDAPSQALEDRKGVIKSVLDKLAESAPDNSTIVDRARKCLDECTEFAIERQLVTVPEEPIKLIVMPEFRRGVAVAYCDAPGPLEKHGETFYAIAPTPKDWPAARVSSFFREYNDYMLHDLTIHEAVPGHYLQLAHANKFRAPTLVRAIFSSGPFVEGWATYAEQLMAEQGYGGSEVRMQQLKMRLRMIINAIIDQKIHTAGMTQEEAMNLMMNEGFQEEGEAAGKWRRACLTSTQLSTYFVGNIEVNDIRSAYRQKYGENSDMKAMHDKMLSYGSPPAKYVKSLMGL